MAKYRKLPVAIEAVKIDKRMNLTFPEWWSTAVRENEVILHGMGKMTRDEPWVEVDTLEGIMRGNKGDYLIKGINNELYPCKPEIFEKTYEKVED